MQLFRAEERAAFVYIQGLQLACNSSTMKLE